MKQHSQRKESSSPCFAFRFRFSGTFAGGCMLLE
jgi:hypothetical protein